MNNSTRFKNAGGSGRGGASANKGAYRVNSWTQNPNHHHGGGGGRSIGANRSYSMTSFHPPLCVYTPSPGAMGYAGGAWANGPPRNLGVGQHGGPPPPSSSRPIVHGHGGQIHFSVSPVGGGGGFSAQQLPFYFNCSQVPTNATQILPPVSNGSSSTSKIRTTSNSGAESLVTTDETERVDDNDDAVASTSATAIANDNAEMEEREKLFKLLTTAEAEPIITEPKKLLKPTMPAVYRMMTDLSLTHNLCAVCCKKNGRLCTGCRRVAYCSDKCQKSDWPEHKWKCDPPVILDKSLALYTMRSEIEARNMESINVSLCGTNTTRTTTTTTPSSSLSSSIGIDEHEGTAFIEEGFNNESTHTITLESDTGDETAPPDEDEEGKKTKERYTGNMLTRKVCKPCDLVASIQPIMMTCGNTNLTPSPPDSVICLNCTRWYQASLGYRCSNCRWPVCSLECENSYLHSNFECPVFSASKKLPPPLKDHTQFYNDAVLIIRCLLLKIVDPPKYMELIDLMDICRDLDKKEQFIMEDRKIISYLKNECLIDDFVEMSVELLLDFLNVVDACSILVQDRIFIQVNDNGKSYFAPKFVFPMKMYVTQDCIPNSKWSIKHSPKFEECFLRIHAATELQPRTYVTTCFNSDKHVIGSWFQNDLNVSKFTNRCSCRRCVDPTELGSFFSGVKCEFCWHKKLEGYLLPSQPLNPNSVWKCTNGSCNKVMRSTKMREMILKFHEEIFDPNVHEDFYALVQLKYRFEQQLHQNHFLILKISVICVMLFWGSVRGLPFFSPRYDFFISTINLANEALRIYDYICPGMSIQRARVLFQIQVANAYKHLRDIRRHMEWGMEQFERNKQSPTPGFPVSFWELIEIQEEAHAVLKTEPYGTMEHEMANVLQEVIEDQKDLLCTTPKDTNLDITAVYNLHKIYTRFSNQYYYPAIPIYEDKDIHEFVVMTGPCARHIVEKLNFPI